MPEQAKGFSLIEVLLVVIILSVLSGMVYLMINPAEAAKKRRDAVRMSDAQLVFKAVHLAIDAKGEPSPKLLCGLLSTPCKGSTIDTNPDLAKSNGMGWVKAQVDNIAGISVPALPIDPINVSPFIYEYFATGYDFEVNTQFESDEYSSKMELDGGDNNNKFELGTKLNLIH